MNDRFRLTAVLCLAALLLGSLPLAPPISSPFASVPRAPASVSGPGPGPYTGLDPVHSELVRLTMSNVAYTLAQRIALAQVESGFSQAAAAALVDGDERAFLDSFTMNEAAQVQAILHPDDSTGTNTLLVGLGGCVGGAVFGAVFGGPVGAGVGCVAVGLATAIAFYMGTRMSAQDSLNQQAVAWLRAEISVVGNCANTTGGFLGNALQLLNFTQDYFDSRADSAAVDQLGNSTFNVLLDETQSGTAVQAMDVQWAAAQSAAQCQAAFQSWYVANFGPNGRFSSVPSPSIDLVTLVSTTDSYNPTSVPQWAGADVEALGTSSNQYVYLAQGTITVVNHCVTTCNGNTFAFNAWPVGGGPPIRLWGCTASNTTCWPSPAVFAGPSGIYNVTATSGPFTANFLFYGGADIQTASNGGQWVAWTAETGNVTGGNYHEGIVVSAAANAQTTNSVPFYGNASWNPVYPNKLLIRSAQAAQTYWAFLKGLGFSSASQIPADCVIPYPNEVLPPTVDLQGLSISEYQSLFYGWLTGLATFFNTTLNSTNFCGTQGHRQFQIGNDSYWPLFVNVTLSVYIPNATLYPGETFGNVSSWAYTHVQALVTPLLGTIRFPLGQPFNIPENDPVSLFLPQRGVWLNLYGNGTNVSLPNPICATGCGLASGSSAGRITAAFQPLASKPPGDAVYLYSCIIGGVPAANCTVVTQTINQTILFQNASCQPSCGPGGGAGFTFTLPNPFAWLADAFCALLGPFLGPNCVGDLSLLFEVVFVLVVVLVVVYVVNALWPRRGSSRETGRGG